MPNARAAVTERSAKVLVLGRGTGAFLSVIRSLGRAGLEVHVGWESQGAPALRSRYVHRVHRIASADQRARDRVSQLISLMRRERFDMVMPTNEAGLRALHENSAELERWGRLPHVSDPSYAALLDKATVARLARSIGLPVEAIGHTAVRAAPRRVGVGLLTVGGALQLAFQHEHVHEPVHEGGGSYVQSVPLTQMLVDAATSLLRAVDFTGVALVEFGHDPDAGTWGLVDVNAGFWESLPVALVAGVDFPLGLYVVLTGGTAPLPRGYRTGVRSRHLTGDMVWLLTRARASGPGVMPAVRLLKDVAGEAVRSILAGREHLDAFAIDDPRPLSVEAGQALRKGFKLARRRAWRRLAGWPLIRRHLARKTIAAVRSADRVLFVCAGNICRSPFAEHRARALGIFPVVASAGHDASETDRSPPHAVETALAWDVNLLPHRPRRIEEADVRTADAIFIFDEDNEQRLIDLFPMARERIHYIGALRGHGPLFVDDPYGGSLDQFERSYREIESALGDMARARRTHKERGTRPLTR